MKEVSHCTRPREPRASRVRLGAHESDLHPCPLLYRSTWYRNRMLLLVITSIMAISWKGPICVAVRTQIVASIEQESLLIDAAQARGRLNAALSWLTDSRMHRTQSIDFEKFRSVKLYLFSDALRKSSDFVDQPCRRIMSIFLGYFDCFEWRQCAFIRIIPLTLWLWNLLLCTFS